MKHWMKMRMKREIETKHNLIDLVSDNGWANFHNPTCSKVKWSLCYFLRSMNTMPNWKLRSFKMMAICELCVAWAIIFKQWKRAMWTSCIWSRPFLAIGFLDISKCSSIVQWGWHTGSHGKVYNDSHHLIKQRLTTNSRRTNLTWD